ncbi:sterol 24-C-methyltransferase [Aureococcus anophagefferens]|uniref:Sterol 24-C-methyltransferase n=1 Tax=Aureococcus anophagefferens TaxID=44056 RepID=A0ABR1FSM8_AURAN
MNLEEAARLGVKELISVVEGQLQRRATFPPKKLPKITHIVSCEVFCHAASKPALLSDIFKMLEPGGALGDDMVKDGVPRPYLDKWIASLTDRVKIQGDEAVFAWGLFSARKPGPLY